MTRKFVIISMPRSGSRMLSSALNYTRNEKESWCWNELLRPDVLAKKQQIGHPSNDIFRECNQQDELDVMNTFFDFKNKKISCAGFVAHFWNGFEETSRPYELTDNLNPWPYLIRKSFEDDQFSFVLLYRKNLFRRYVSHVVANGGESGEGYPCWHMFKEEKRNIKVTINREKAIANIAQAKSKIAAMKNLFCINNFLTVKYEDIETDFEGISANLTASSYNLTCPREIKPVTTKIIQDYSSVVENWDEVKDLDHAS